MSKFSDANKRTADGYVDFPHALVHEMTHARVGGRAKVNAPPPRVSKAYLMATFIIQ